MKLNNLASIPSLIQFVFGFRQIRFISFRFQAKTNGFNQDGIVGARAILFKLHSILSISLSFQKIYCYNNMFMLIGWLFSNQSSFNSNLTEKFDWKLIELKPATLLFKSYLFSFLNVAAFLFIL